MQDSLFPQIFHTLLPQQLIISLKFGLILTMVLMKVEESRRILKLEVAESLDSELSLQTTFVSLEIEEMFCLDLNLMKRFCCVYGNTLQWLN